MCLSHHDNRRRRRGHEIIASLYKIVLEHFKLRSGRPQHRWEVLLVAVCDIDLTIYYLTLFTCPQFRWPRGTKSLLSLSRPRFAWHILPIANMNCLVYCRMALRPRYHILTCFPAVTFIRMVLSGPWVQATEFPNYRALSAGQSGTIQVLIFDYLVSRLWA